MNDTGRRKRWLVSLGVYMVVESEPGTQSSCQPQKRRDHRTRTTAARRTKHRTALLVACSKFWQKAVRPGAHSLPCLPTKTDPGQVPSVTVNRSRHLAPLLSGSAQACGAIWKLGPPVDQSGAGKKLMGSRLINKLWDTASKAGSSMLFIVRCRVNKYRL